MRAVEIDCLFTNLSMMRYYSGVLNYITFLRIAIFSNARFLCILYGTFKIHVSDGCAETDVVFVLVSVVVVSCPII